MIYVLMMLTVNMGWVVMTVDGNPYNTKAECEAVERVVQESGVRVWEGVRFHRVKCKPREVEKV